VVNAYLPKSHEQYVHRVGRTARAGRQGRAVSLSGDQERRVFKQILRSSTAPVKQRLIEPCILCIISIATLDIVS